MNLQRSFYRIYDPSPNGCFEIGSQQEQSQFNDQKWGIFWTVNEFRGPRIKENLVRINSWAVDIDKGTKSEQKAKIKTLLEPSLVIETKKGYHVYFHAVDGTPENYTPIVERIIYHLNGDPNAKDVCRILRVPDTLHWKDPAYPFYIHKVHESNLLYTEKEMFKFFKEPPRQKHFSENTKHLVSLRRSETNNFWENAGAIDCEYGLKVLSGSTAVCGDVFSFKHVSNGNLNIIVNGKSTSCFIDKNKKIGSGDRGGPTIGHWINWYQRDWKKTKLILEQYFPELRSQK